MQAADPAVINSSVDGQIRVALLLGTPVLLWMMVLSPVVLHVMYAADFQAASGILRWQLLGDILKIAGWAVAFLLLARKARGAFFLAELSFKLCYLLLGIPLAMQYGLNALGMAYVGAYAAYLLVTLWLARRETGFLVQRRTFILIAGCLATALVTLLSVESGSSVGMYAGVMVASLVTIASLSAIFWWRAKERRSTTEVGTLV